MDSKRDIPLKAALWTRPHGRARSSGDALSAGGTNGAASQPANALFAASGAAWTSGPLDAAPNGAIAPVVPLLMPTVTPVAMHPAAAAQTEAPAQPQHPAEVPQAAPAVVASAPDVAESAPPSQAAPQIAPTQAATSQSAATHTLDAPNLASQSPAPQAATTAAQVAPVEHTAQTVSDLSPQATGSAAGASNAQTEQIDFASGPVAEFPNTQAHTYSLPSSLYQAGTFVTGGSFGGASITAGVTAFAGIKGSVSMGLGDVTPNYPVSIDPNALDAVIDNTVFTIDPSLISTNDASFSLALPTAQANLDIGLQAEAHMTIDFPKVPIGVSIPFYGYVGTTISLGALPIQLSVNAAFNPAQNTVFNLGEGASLTVSQINQSSVSSGTASATGSLPSLSASGSTPSFLTGTVDLVQLLGDILPESGLKAVDGSQAFSVGAASWSLFSLPLSVSLGLGETATATPMGIMETATDELNGEVQTGTLGSTLTFNAPASGTGVIPIDISYALELQVTTSLGLDGTISLALDGPSVSATVLGVGGLSEGPFGNLTLFSESGQFAQLASATINDTLTGSSVVDVAYAATAVSQTITMPSGGVLLNSEEEQLTNTAGTTIAGATYGIEAAVLCVPNITNAGTVSAEAYRASNPGTPTPSSYGIDLLGGGMVTNVIGGVITSSNAGTSSHHGSDNPDASIRLAANQANDVANAGLITGFETGVQINGGVLTNAATGTITTNSLYVSYGIKVGNDGVQITNSGLIDSSYGIKLSGGGEVTNTASGIIEGLAAGGIEAGGSLTLTNSGTITASFAGVAANGGIVLNLSGGLISGAFEAGVSLGGNTALLVNAGTIAGNGAVYLDASSSNTLIVAQGAVFDGTVQAGNASASNGIYLAAGSTGTLAGIGTEFTGFQSVTIGQGATWQIAGSAASFGTTSMEGFKPGDALDFTGLAFTGRGPGYITGESVQVDDATGTVSIIEAQSLSSSGITLATAQFGGARAGAVFTVASDGDGGTLLEETGLDEPGPLSSTISTQGLGGIVLAAGSVYASLLTITAAGSAADQATVSGQTVNINYGIQTQGEAASITNAGSVAGYRDGIYLTQGGTISNLAGGIISGATGTGVDITGGIGIVLNSGLIEGTTGAALAGGGTLTNYAGGTITGRLLAVDLGPQANGLGELVNEGLLQSSSGTAVQLTGGGFVYNEHGGVIAGGSITGRDFGVLATNDFAKVTNCGSISGGTGIDLTAGGFVVNENGTIDGGVEIAGGVGYLSSCGSISGVSGVGFSAGGTIVNSAVGTIIGTQSYGVSLGAGSGSGSDQVENSGLIESASTGAILSSASNTLFNAGAIVDLNGDAVQMEGTTTNKLQLAAGFRFVGDVVAKSGAANSIELTASATAGVLAGLGTSLLGFSAVTLDAGADWTIDTTAAEAASLRISGQSSADTLALTGGGALGTNVSGFGTLLLEGPGTFTIAASSVLSENTIALSAGATLSGAGTLKGALSDAGVLVAAGGSLSVSGAVLGTGGTLLADSGAVLHLEGGGALGAAMLGAGELFLDGTYSFAGNTPFTVAKLVIDYGAALSATGTMASAVNDAGTLTASGGTLVLTGSVGGNGTLLAASGAVLDITSSGDLTKDLAGAGTIRLDGASTTYGTATTSTVATLAVDSGAKLSGAGTISSAVIDSGSIDASGGTLVLGGAVSGAGTWGASTGATLDLTAGGTLSGATSGGGTLQLDGSATTTLTAKSLSVGLVRIDAGAVLSSTGTNAITGPVADAGVLVAAGGSLSVSGAVLGTGGTLLADSGAVLHLEGGGALGAAMLGAGELFLDGTYSFAGNTPFTVAKLVIDYGAALSATGTMASAVNDAGTLTASGGTLVLTGSVGGNGTLLAASGAVLDIKSSGDLTKDLAGAGTIRLDGASTTYGTATTSTVATLAVDSGAKLSGAGSIASAVINAGSIVATGGTLSFLGAVTNNGVADAASGLLSFTNTVSGTGSLEIGAAGGLALLAGEAASQTVAFSGSGGVLDLSQASAFLGSLADFSSHDTIDLINTAANGFSYAPDAKGGVLTLTENGGTVAHLQFDGTYSSSSFSLVSDLHGGTSIIVV